MNDALKEQVSAFVDGELKKEEKALLLRRLAQSPALKSQVGRHSLIGEAMRRGLPPVIDTGFADRISAALEQESRHRASRTVALREALLRPVAGLAVAASVAAISLAVWPTADDPTATATASSMQAATASQPRSGLQTVSSNDYGQWERLEPQIQQRLNDYLVNHSEHTATGRFGGMLNYVRITGHESDE